MPAFGATRDNDEQRREGEPRQPPPIEIGERDDEQQRRCDRDARFRKRRDTFAPLRHREDTAK